MGAETGGAAASRSQAFVRAVLRNTRMSLLGLALAVGADILAGPARPLCLLVAAGLVALGWFACLRFPGKGCFVGLVSVVISVWSGLVTLLLLMDSVVIA